MKDKLGDFPPLSTLSICHWKQKTETKCHNCVFPVTRKLLPQFFSHVNELFLITHLFYRLVSLIMLQFIYVMCFKPTILLLETLVILAFSLLKVAVHLQATLEPTSSHRCLLHVLLGSVLHTKDKYKLCTELKKKTNLLLVELNDLAITHTHTQKRKNNTRLKVLVWFWDEQS